MQLSSYGRNVEKQRQKYNAAYDEIEKAAKNWGCRTEKGKKVPSRKQFWEDSLTSIIPRML